MYVASDVLFWVACQGWLQGRQAGTFARSSRSWKLLSPVSPSPSVRAQTSGHGIDGEAHGGVCCVECKVKVVDGAGKGGTVSGKGPACCLEKRQTHGKCAFLPDGMLIFSSWKWVCVYKVRLSQLSSDHQAWCLYLAGARRGFVQPSPWGWRYLHVSRDRTHQSFLSLWSGTREKKHARHHLLSPGSYCCIISAISRIEDIPAVFRSCTVLELQIRKTYTDRPLHTSTQTAREINALAQKRGGRRAPAATMHVRGWSCRHLSDEIAVDVTPTVVQHLSGLELL